MQINLRARPGLDDDVLPDDIAEPGERRRDGVDSRRQIQEVVITASARDDLLRGGRGAGQGHRDTGNNATARIGDDAIDAARLLLGPCG